MTTAASVAWRSKAAARIARCPVTTVHWFGAPVRIASTCTASSSGSTPRPTSSARCADRSGSSTISRSATAGVVCLGAIAFRIPHANHGHQ
uniref:Uncharacterized protein n=1 Tax=Anopheles albimanus TaxID=7167 RepID=A0A182F206_ANOAL